MTLQEIILFLRQQLLELQTENDREAVKQLLDTCKVLTKAAYEGDDKEAVELLIQLGDAARALHMGHVLNGNVPSEASIREKMQPESSTPTSAQTATSSHPKADMPTTTMVIEALTPEALAPLQAPYDHEQNMHKRLRKVSERNWQDYTPIRDGSPRQMQAYSIVFDELMVFLHLKKYNPMWVGSYPIGLDTENSDIDIVLNPEPLRGFLTDARKLYGHYDDFRLTWKAIDNVPTVFARFKVNGFDVELFAQPRPITVQFAFVQMLVTARLLAIGGDDAREGIRKLKREGKDSREALMAYFDVETDNPHDKILQFARLDNDRLRAAVGHD